MAQNSLLQSLSGYKRPLTLQEIAMGKGQLDNIKIDRKQRPTAKSRSLFSALMSMNGMKLKT